jgi:hypothetical protein
MTRSREHACGKRCNFNITIPSTPSRDPLDSTPLLPLQNIINPLRIHRLLPINHILNTLDALPARIEKLIPKAGLFAVVRTAAPALPVVQVVVLGAQLGADEVQKPGVGAGGRDPEADATL